MQGGRTQPPGHRWQHLTSLRDASAQAVRTVRHWAAWLLPVVDLLLPPRCAFCGNDLDEAGTSPAQLPESHPLFLCQPCIAALTVWNGPLPCPRCGAAAPAVMSADGIAAAGNPLAKDGSSADAGSPDEPIRLACPECARGKFRFEQLCHLGAYQADLRQAVLRCKHPQHGYLAATLSELLWRRNQERLTTFAPELVVPIPMHWRQRTWRGANAPETIATRLAAHLNVPMHLTLRRARATKPQHHLGRAARLTNVRRAFRLRRGYHCRGARVLVVDDVVTTGATVNAAAKVLLAAGAQAVAVAALARADSPH
jgi:ComF family protein